MTTSHTTSSAVAARRSPRRNTVAGTKAKQRKNSGASRSLNGKSSSRKTKMKVVTDVQSDSDDIEVHRTPPNKTKIPVLSEKKRKAVVNVESDVEVDPTPPKRRRLLCRQSQWLRKGKQC